jgi:phage tail P2-like protein
MAVIDELPERILDVLAVELRTPYYQESMNLETKRNIIKRTLLWHTKAGTPSAVSELIEIVFGEGRTEEWFDYTEGPYTPGTFDIITNARMTEEMANYFLSIIQRVKNTRSHIRRILVEREMEMHETVASVVVSSPKEQVLNHHQTTNDYTMQETAASAVTSAPSRTVTNHPEGRTGDIGMEGNAAAGAVSSPHETIGNNVNPRTGTLLGGVSGFAAIVVRNTKTTILNGAQRTQASVHGTVPRVAVGMASHSKITT